MKKIKLTQNKFALVDNKDFEYLNQFNWMYVKKYHGEYGYAIRKKYSKETQKCIGVFMHREINKTPKQMETDHINGNGLDNRRCNLRSVSAFQNRMNKKLQSNSTSGFKGVTWDRAVNKWRAQIEVNKKNKYLGIFKLKKDAAIAYNNAAIKYYKKYARLNKII